MPEILHVAPVLARGALEHLAAQLALEGEPRELRRDVLDLGVEAGRVQQEPSIAGVGRGDPVLVPADPGDGAVVDDLALLVAPGRVVDLIDLIFETSRVITRSSRRPASVPRTTYLYRGLRR